jgi:hypothetical protein
VVKISAKAEHFSVLIVKGLNQKNKQVSFEDQHFCSLNNGECNKH